jgi:hypothetical protein
MNEDQGYTAFAHDSTGHPGPDPVTGDDGARAPSGVTIEDAEGRTIAGKSFRWPSGEFSADAADEILGTLGFRRAGDWEWLGWDWRAPAAATRQADQEQESEYLPSDLGTSLDDPETTWTAPFRRRQQS